MIGRHGGIYGVMALLLPSITIVLPKNVGKRGRYAWSPRLARGTPEVDTTAIIEQTEYLTGVLRTGLS